MAHTVHAVERVTQWLEERGVDYELVTHAETFTAADAARVAGVPAGHVAKTIALHQGRAYRLVVIPASRRLDLSRLRELSGGSPHLRLATEHEMKRDFPDFEVGALPPSVPCCQPRRWLTSGSSTTTASYAAPATTATPSPSTPASCCGSPSPGWPTSADGSPAHTTSGFSERPRL